LGEPVSKIGYTVGVYAAASAAAGLLLAPRLERFNRRVALSAALAGQAVSIGLCATAHSYTQFLLARAAAGVFSAPAVSLVLALVADLISTPRQGRALSSIMLAHSVSMSLGVAAGLFVSKHLGWQAAFLF